MAVTTTSRTTFVPDAGFGSAFLANPSVGRLMGAIANRVADSAEAKAPRRFGYLKGGIDASVARGSDGRLIGVVASHDWKTMLIEHGTRRQRARPFLFPALIETLPNSPLFRGR